MNEKKNIQCFFFINPNEMEEHIFYYLQTYLLQGINLLESLVEFVGYTKTHQNIEELSE